MPYRVLMMRDISKDFCNTYGQSLRLFSSQRDIMGSEDEFSIEAANRGGQGHLYRVQIAKTGTCSCSRLKSHSLGRRRKALSRVFRCLNGGEMLIRHLETLHFTLTLHFLGKFDTHIHNMTALM